MQSFAKSVGLEVDRIGRDITDGHGRTNPPPANDLDFHDFLAGAGVYVSAEVPLVFWPDMAHLRAGCSGLSANDADFGKIPAGYGEQCQRKLIT